MAVGRRSRAFAFVIGFGACALLLAGFFNVFENMSVHTMYLYPYDKVNSWLASEQRSALQLTTTNLNEEILTSLPLMSSTSAHVTLDPVTPPKSVYSDRIHHLRHICSNKSLVDNPVYKGNTEIVYFISKEYNFTYCKVPKTGCTFMTQTLSILKYGLENKDNILSKRRSSVHSDGRAFLVPFNSPERQQSRTIMVTRNPFSRLLSAYIDKIYMLLNPSVFIQIRNLASKQTLPHPPIDGVEAESSYTEPGRNCSSSVHFEGFLRFIIDNVRKGRVLDRHWSPISRLCRPCNVNTYFIIKQESYSKDLTYFLKTLNVENETLDVIFDAMNGQRAVTSLPGILSVVYSGVVTPSKKSAIIDCLGLEGFHRRIWSALQMQGFIGDDVEYPVDEIRAHGNDVWAMRRIILDTVEKLPVSPEAMKAQRRKTLVKAFEGVSEETIEAIRDIYRQDFELFGYSMDVPTE